MLRHNAVEPEAGFWRGGRARQWTGRGVLVLLAGLTLLLLVCLARRAPPIQTLDDMTVTELYVLLAMKGRLLVGPYSRFGWHHPGPLYFLTQIPIYTASGYRQAGLYAGAVAINLAALATLAWVAWRLDRGVLALIVTLSVLCLAWRADVLLASPWTAHVPLLPSVAFVVVTAGVASGCLQLLPVVILLGSFIAQTHVAFVPLVTVLTAGAMGPALCRPRRQGRSPWPILVLSAATFGALWLLPLVEEFSRTPGNLTKLWQFFVTDNDPPQPLGISIAYWSDALLGILRSRVKLPWGGPAELVASNVSMAAAVALVLLLPVVAFVGHRAGRRFETSMALTALAASLVGLWSLTRIRADVLGHETFWLVGIGTLDLAILAAAVVRAGLLRWLPQSLHYLQASPVLGAAICAIVLSALPIGIRHFHDRLNYLATRRADLDVVSESNASIRRYMASAHVAKPIIEINTVWGIAAGTFVELEKAGIPFAVEDRWLPMFSDAYATTGEEDAFVTMGRLSVHRELAGRPGNVVVSEHGAVYIDGIRGDVPR